MNTKLDILNKYIKDYMVFYEIDADKPLDISATKALSEIESAVQNEKYSDSEAIEIIVSVFEKHNLILGTKCDF